MSRTDIEKIKERLPIDTVIGQYIKLEKAGKSYKARCPFHSEKSASFFVSPDRGGYYCFGCGAKGDIFSFVEQFEGLDFKGALKILAERAGVILHFDEKTDNEREMLFKIMEESSAFYEEQLSKSAMAKEYIKKRGLSDKTVSEFRLGFAPDGWRNLSVYLLGKGYSEALMQKAGLIKKKDNQDGGETTSGYYDRFRGRIMFPITDSSGRIIAFTGRILNANDSDAKYLNSPDTPLYDKSAVLYGLHKAKSYIRQLNYAILVEGQMDLIMSHQAGVKNAVASSGTALADVNSSEAGAKSNMAMVRRLAPNIIIAFDSDLAGRKAALRASSLALSMGMDVKVADLNSIPQNIGKDPADIILEDVEKWKNVLRNAKPIVEFELANVILDIKDTRKIPQALKERVFPFLSRIESEMDKSHYVGIISDKTHIPTDAIWRDLRNVEAQNKANEKANTTGAPVNASVIDPQSRRLDLVERRVFGLLALMDNEKHPDAQRFRDRLREISKETYDERNVRIHEIIGDVLFEAESLFGTSPVEQKQWPVHMEELLINFEEDMINDKLIETMQTLKSAERAGNTDEVSRLARICQELSITKSEITKRRSH